MRTKTVLRKARKLIETPEQWCKDRDHRTLGYGKRATHQYCARGAVAAATHRSKSRRAAHRVLFSALPTDYMCGIIGFNDKWDTTHADVLAVFDRAIESL